MLGAWLGALEPDIASARRAAALRIVNGLTGERKAELRGEVAWLDGMLAFARRDQNALEDARQDGRRSGHIYASMIDRSLGAFGRSLRGDRAAAGRELAALEWSWVRPDFGDFVAPNIALNRLAAATWLLESGDTAQAARLLIWFQSTDISGWEASFTYAVTPLAHLMLAQIEEGRGNSLSAKAHYVRFLGQYDSPMPTQGHLVEEARAALGRLSGQVEQP